MVKDIKGKKVTVGSKVKVLRINPIITEYLPEDEVHDINSMINEVLEVYEIDKNGYAYVEKNWDRGEGMYESHRLPLSSSEMELIESAS